MGHRLALSMCVNHLMRLMVPAFVVASITAPYNVAVGAEESNVEYGTVQEVAYSQRVPVGWVVISRKDVGRNTPNWRYVSKRIKYVGNAAKGKSEQVLYESPVPADWVVTARKDTGRGTAHWVYVSKSIVYLGQHRVGQSVRVIYDSPVPKGWIVTEEHRAGPASRVAFTHKTIKRVQ